MTTSVDFVKKVREDFSDWGKVYDSSELMAKLNENLKKKGFLKENSRLVFSVCSDDINRLEEIDTIENAIRKEYNGDFQLGGLAAFPIGGVSALVAVSQHTPDVLDNSGQKKRDGNLIIYISPHVGLIKQEDFQYGFSIRPGQRKPTFSCGAMVGFLMALKEAGDPESFNIAPDDRITDPTREILHNSLINNYSPELSEILSIEDGNAQMIALFKLNYELCVSKLNQMISLFLKREKEHFHGNLAVISGITVNLSEKDIFILKEISFPII